MRRATETEGPALRCDLAHGANADRLCEWCGGRLPPRRRKWCSNDCGRAFSDNHFWTNARRVAMERAGFRCESCGTIHRLEVHHEVPVGAHGYARGCVHHLGGLKVLCHREHVEAERFRRQVDAVVEWATAETFRAWADGAPAVQMVLPGIAA